MKFVVLALILGLGGLGWADTESRVVVVANSAMSASMELASAYMEARGIPESRLCALDLPEEEAMSRTAFDVGLRDPLRRFLVDRGLVKQGEAEDGRSRIESASVRYLVLMHGVPLRVSEGSFEAVRRVIRHIQGHERKTTASVDTELATVLFDAYPLEGPFSNPVYRQWNAESLGSAGRIVLLTARLDGPTPEIVRGMIRGALEGERYGLVGRAYFDTRAIDDPGYAQGDYWIEEARARFEREDFVCVSDRTPAVWGRAYPMSGAGLYMGWYQPHVVGPFEREGFRFLPGAIAYHIHSASASTLRDPNENWAAPLLARGAAATMGAVAEPFLYYTPHLDIFADRLCRGFTFGESAYLSMPALSWQVTVVGDPLYTPFKYSLDEQIRHMEADGSPYVEWGYIRRFNELMGDGRRSVALRYAQEKLEQGEYTALRELVAETYARNEEWEAAGPYFERVLRQDAQPEAALRAGARWILILRLFGQTGRAEAIEQMLRERWAGHASVSWLDTAKP